MIQKLSPRSLLEELDTRHDEVLDQLEQLNERLEAVLREVTGPRAPVPAAPVAVAAETAP